MNDQLIFTRAMAIAILADMVTAVTGSLIDFDCRLYQNDATPTPDSLLADFDVASYDGYADGAVTWSVPTIADDGEPEVVGTVPEFRPTGAAVPNVIYGGILLNGAGAYVGGWRFATGPVAMNSALDAILAHPRVRVTPSGLAVVVS